MNETGGAPGTAPSCCICFDNTANAVNMQCGHGGICYECGKSILMSNTRLCHLCREISSRLWPHHTYQMVILKLIKMFKTQPLAKSVKMQIMARVGRAALSN